MPTSKTLQSTILKTKKRLSKDDWSQTTLLMLILVGMAYYSFAIFQMTIDGEYGLVHGRLPVVAAEVVDPSMPWSPDIQEQKINEKSVMIVLTSEALYFGHIEAFSRDFSGVRNKFLLPHEEGSPQLGKLLATIDQWQPAKAEAEAAPVIFMPTAEVPMPIVIQVMDGLQASERFNHVVLSSGIL